MKELRLSMFSILFRASWSYELSFPTREYLLPKGAQWSCRLGLFFGDKKTHDFPIQVDFRKESPISAMDSNRWTAEVNTFALNRLPFAIQACPICWANATGETWLVHVPWWVDYIWWKIRWGITTEPTPAMFEDITQLIIYQGTKFHGPSEWKEIVA